MVMSGFFVFLCGYCIACLVHPEDRGARRWWVGSYWAFKRLVIFSAATAATLWAVHRLSSAWHNRFDWSEQERMVGAAYRALLDVESNEVGWMFFSIPVVTATFAASYLVIVALASLIGRCRRVNLMSAAVASLLAVAVLWGLGKVCEPVVRNSREANLVRFQGSARMGTWLNPNDIREDPTRIQGQRLQRSDLALEGFVAFARFTGSDYAFHPPFSAVLLWQGPYRAGY